MREHFECRNSLYVFTQFPHLTQALNQIARCSLVETFFDHYHRAMGEYGADAPQTIRSAHHHQTFFQEHGRFPPVILAIRDCPKKEQAPPYEGGISDLTGES